MINSRLVEIIQNLQKREITKVRQFLKSPFFNQRQDVINLFNLIVATAEVPTKEQAAAVLYPDEDYDIQQIRFVMSWLTKRLEDYFVVQSTLEDQVSTKLKLAEQLQKRGIQRQWQAAQRVCASLLAKQSYQTASYYRHRYRLLAGQNQEAARQRRTAKLNLQEQNDMFDAYYLTEKLRQACYLLSHQAVYKTKYDLGLLQTILPTLSTAYVKQWPAVHLYWLCYQMLNDTDGLTHFLQLKKSLSALQHLFPASELRDIYLLVINFSIRQMNAGHFAFGQEAFHLYQLCLEKDLLTMDGYLSRFAYRNIVALGLQLKAYDWVEQFLQAYKPHLAPQHRKATYSFNRAKLAYEKQDYQTVLSCLQRAEYRDVLLNLAAKTLLLKVYYLQKEDRLLTSHLTAMARFIYRKKVMAYHRENYTHIVRTTQKLLELNPFDTSARQLLLQEVEQLEPLTEKAWFLEQIVNI